MYKSLPARHMKRVRAIQDQIVKETGSPKSTRSPVNTSATNRLMNTAKHVIFPSDAVEETKIEANPDIIKGRVEKLKEELDDIIAGECILCGDVMIKAIDQPFINSEEMAIVASWAI